MLVTPLFVAAIGAVILVASIAGARHPIIHPREVAAFQAINRLPNWLYVPLWLPMQLGNLVVGTVVGLLVAVAVRSVAVAVGVVLAMVAKLVVERGVRRRVAEYLDCRQRPGTSQPESIQRGADVPLSGPSFPSGHVILVAAVGTVLTTALPLELEWIPFVLAALVAIGRVYVGAHNPLDVTAGFGAGLVIGGLLAVPLVLVLA